MSARDVLLEMAIELEEQAARYIEGAKIFPLVDGVPPVCRVQDEAKAEGYSLAAQRLRAKVATLPDDGLPKPDHVEEGQMWTRLDDYRTIELVRANSDVDFDNGRWERAETLLTSPNWRYIGMKEKR